MEINVILDVISLRKALKTITRNRLLKAIIPYILIIIYAMFQIISNIISKDDNLYLNVVILVIALVGLVLPFVRLSKGINLQIKQMKQIFDGDSCEYLFNFNEEDITHNNLKSSNVFSIKHSDIAKCIESKELILFSSKLKQFVYIPKNGINDSQREYIINLIKNKNILYKKLTR